MNSKIAATLEILRPFNVAIMMLVVGSAVILAGGTGDDWIALLIAAMAGGLIGGAANAINDYFDVDIDRINKPNRPLPRGALSARYVIRLWFILSFVGISLNLFLNWRAFWIAAGAVVILFFYSARWKRRLLIGNLAVAVMTAMAFVYGAVVLGQPERAVLPALFAFLLNFGREIIKDVEDLEGDRAGAATTLAVRYGVRPALILASAVLGILLMLTFAPYFSGLYNESYLRIVLVVDVLIAFVLISMWKDSTPANLGRMSLLLKITMLLGLLALYVGS